jgi:Uncharacterized conserved protein (DUF2039)
MQAAPVNIMDRHKKLQVKKSGTSHKAKKHQNLKSFKLQYNDHHILMKDSADMGRLCKECYPKIKWKLHFGKYKPRTQAGKCNICLIKNVVKAYRHNCDKCSDTKKVCSKCSAPVANGYHTESIARLSPNEISTEINLFFGRLHKLHERSRRKVQRLRGEDICEFKNDTYWNKKEEREVSCLRWRKKDGEDDEEDSDSEEEKKPEGQTKKQQDDSDDDDDDDEDDDDDDYSDDESSEEKPKKKVANKPKGKK